MPSVMVALRMAMTGISLLHCWKRVLRMTVVRAAAQQHMQPNG